jgi:hypothetical protein
MPSRSFFRITALCGALFAVLTLVGATIVGSSSDLATVVLPTHDEAVRMASTAAPTSLWIGRGIEVGGTLMFAAFATALIALLRSDEKPESRWLASLASLGAAAFVTLTLASLAVWSTLDERAGHGLDATGATVLADLKSIVFFLSWPALATFLVAAGALARRAAIVPAWIGRTAVGIGVLELPAACAPTVGVSQLVQMLGYLWALAVSVTLVLRSRGALSPAREAAMMGA